MKRTKLKQRSKDAKWKNKADRCFQDFLRRETGEVICYICGAPLYCFHHFIEKHLSANLRFDRDNCVPICKSCHTKHHLGGDATIHAVIQIKKGSKWLVGILKKRLVILRADNQWYKSQYEKYKL